MLQRKNIITGEAVAKGVQLCLQRYVMFGLLQSCSRVTCELDDSDELSCQEPLGANNFGKNGRFL